jgi:hypothetical protein
VVEKLKMLVVVVAALAAPKEKALPVPAAASVGAIAGMACCVTRRLGGRHPKPLTTWTGFAPWRNACNLSSLVSASP